MNLPKIMLTTCLACLTGLSSSSLLANAGQGLQALTENEMSQVTLSPQHYYTTAEHRTLEHRIYEIENELQNYVVNSNILENVDWQPKVSTDDLPALSPHLQAHVENIARGLQSDDPRQGIRIMIDGFEGGIQLGSLNLFGFGVLQSAANLQGQPVQTINKSGVTEANRNLLPLSQR